MSIVAAGSVTGFFHGVVEEAIRAQRVEATDGAASYLVALLSDYAHPDGRSTETFARPLAFQLEEALQTVEPAERFDRLRILGDSILYSCGFFGDHFEAKGLDQGYLIGIGSSAYGAVSTMLRPSERDVTECREDGSSTLDIYRELAEKFPCFVLVLGYIADTSIACGVSGSGDLLKVYERWLKTGSDRLARALSAHGFMPTRGAKGVLQ